MACVDCTVINTINDCTPAISGESYKPVKLHPCDILAITGGATVVTNVTSVDAVWIADNTIPAGFLHGSILIRTGTATINGAARPTGYQLSLPPMGGNLRYPAYAVTAITGIVDVNYHTLP